MTLARSHQTAVFIDGSRLQSDSRYLNRVKRLVESLNQSGSSPEGTIKADVYTVFPEGKTGIVAGFGGNNSVDASFDGNALVDKALANGYTLVLVAH